MFTMFRGNKHAFGNTLLAVGNTLVIHFNQNMRPSARES